jgi:hypothetical protein
MPNDEAAGAYLTTPQDPISDSPALPKWILNYVSTEPGHGAEPLDVSREAFFNAVRMYSQQQSGHVLIVHEVKLPGQREHDDKEQRAHTALALKDRLGEILRSASNLDDTASRRQYLEQELRLTVIDHGNEAVKAIADAVFSPTAGQELAADVLEVAASVEDLNTVRYRKWLIERALKAQSVYLRFAAVSGVLETGDVDFARPLSGALEIENVRPLKRQMQQVLNKLRSGN